MLKENKQRFIKGLCNQNTGMQQTTNSCGIKSNVQQNVWYMQKSETL